MARDAIELSLAVRESVTLNVPMHEGRDVKPGTLAAILKAAGITAEELRNLL